MEAVIFNLPFIFSIAGSALLNNIKVLNSNLILGSIALSGLSIVGLFNLWIAYNQLFSALLSIGSFLLMIFAYFRFKGIENQIILATQEEIQEGNYTLTPDIFSHVTYNEIGHTIDILKSKGLISNKVTYSE